MYMIYSRRHNQWWKMLRSGYTPHTSEAGVYNISAAQDIVFSGLPGQNIAIDEVLAKKIPHASEVDAELEFWRNL